MRLIIYYYLSNKSTPDWPYYHEHSSSLVASHRLRAEIPAKALALRGHDVRAVSGTEDLNSLMPNTPTILIIPKISSPNRSMFTQEISTAMRAIIEARQVGIKVVVDYSDDLVGMNDHRSQGTLKILQTADAVVCSSLPLAQRVRWYVHKSKPVLTIADPVEGVRQNPHAEPHDGITRVLWFGHATNLHSLQNYLGHLEEISRHYSLNLEVLTRLPQAHASGFMAVVNRLSSSLSCNVHLWSGPGSLSKALSRSHLVFHPVNLNGPKRFASNNRITEAIWGGCFVVSAPLNSYMPFQNYACLTTRPEEGLWKYLSQKQPVNHLIAKGQQLIARCYTPVEIGMQWDQFLCSLT